MKIIVESSNRQRKIRISLKRLERTTKKILKVLTEELYKINTSQKNTVTISVVFIGSKKMRELNHKYRGKNYNTDVLSFSYHDNEASLEEFFIGEIFINPEKAKIQARQYGGTLWEEINRLLVHGILHLLGYDHENSSISARKMRKMEEKILKILLQA